MTTRSDPITGSILGIRDCGPIVIVFLNGEEGRVMPVVCDHRHFKNLLNNAGCGPDEIVGRMVSYDTDSLTFVEHRPVKTPQTSEELAREWKQGSGFDKIRRGPFPS